jgi:hypothetical protein
VKLDVPIETQVVAIAAGEVAAVVPLDLTQVNAFSTRFATLFREYAIVGAALEIRPAINSAVTTYGGLCQCFIDEESNSAPIFNTASNRPRLDVSCQNLTEVEPYKIQWTPRDYLDLDFVAVATTFTPAWLKLWCDTASTGSNAGLSGSFIVTGTLAFDFRGYI